MSGSVGFDNGKFFGISQISRNTGFDFVELLNSFAVFQDGLVISTGGAVQSADLRAN